MVTLKMLAKQCGVSVATVSKALNGSSDISAETAARIRKTADEMGYIPCAAARYLKTSRSHSFGVIFDDGTRSGLTHEHFAYMLDSFRRRAEELSYDITLISDQPGPWGSDYATHVKYRNCDGVAVLVADNAFSAVQELLRSGIPVVSVDYTFDGCSTVHSDNAQGMTDLVNHVYSQGHRRIAIILGDESPVTKLRSTWFFRTCERLGIEVREEYVVKAKYHDTEASAQATRQLLSLPEPPTCILYPDDFCCLGGLNEIEKMGLSVPKDVSIVGFDGITLSKILTPKLTTIQQDTRQIGIAAADELARAVEEGSSFARREILVPCTLLPGGTLRHLNP